MSILRALVPKSDDFKVLVVGGVLWYYGSSTFGLLTGVFVFGYITRLMHRTAEYDLSWFERDTNRSPYFPPLDDFAGIVKDGAKAYVIWFTYVVLIPASAVYIHSRTEVNPGEIATTLIAGFFNPLLLGQPFVDDIFEEGLNALLAFPLLGARSPRPVSPEAASAIGLGFLLLVVLYVHPAALANFAETRTLQAGFDTNAFRRTLTPRYFAVWVVFLLLWTASALLLYFPSVDQIGEPLAEIGSAYGTFFGNEIAEYAVLTVELFSFYLLLMSYALIGYAWDQNPSFSFRRWIAARAQFLTRHRASVEAVLVGGLLLSLGIVIPLALVVGYLTSVVSSAADGRRGFPPFRNWWDLLRRGAIVASVWLCYVTLPLVALVIGRTETFDAPPAPPVIGDPIPVSRPLFGEQVSEAVANILVGLVGVQVGVGFAFQTDRLVKDIATLAHVPIGEQPPPFIVGDPFAIPTPAIALFFGSLALSWYVFPAAFVLTVRQSFTAAFRPSMLRRVLFTRTYVIRWLTAFGLWTVGAVPFTAWYVWARSRPNTTEYLPIGLEVIPVPVPVPTKFGLLSAPFLLISSAVSFYALCRGYAVIGRAWAELGRE